MHRLTAWLDNENSKSSKDSLKQNKQLSCKINKKRKTEKKNKQIYLFYRMQLSKYIIYVRMREKCNFE